MISAAKRLFKQALNTASEALNLRSRKPLQLSKDASGRQFDVERSGECRDDVGDVSLRGMSPEEYGLNHPSRILAIVFVRVDVAEDDRRAHEHLFGEDHDAQYGIPTETSHARPQREVRQRREKGPKASTLNVRSVMAGVDGGSEEALEGELTSVLAEIEAHVSSLERLLSRFHADERDATGDDDDGGAGLAHLEVLSIAYDVMTTGDLSATWVDDPIWSEA